MSQPLIGSSSSSISSSSSQHRGYSTFNDSRPSSSVSSSIAGGGVGVGSGIITPVATYIPVRKINQPNQDSAPSVASSSTFHFASQVGDWGNRADDELRMNEI